MNHDDKVKEAKGLLLAALNGKPDLAMELYKRRIMWWPINQICSGCKHEVYIEEKEMDELIIIASGDPDEQLLYHASRCGRGIVLGKLGTGSYSCEHSTYGKE